MLVLITGQPGNGKTLHALGLVEKLRTDPASVAIGREVYQSGINNLALPWRELADPHDWPSLPDGSIVVLDECQRAFPPRKQGAAIPESVKQFETHRHRGFDIFLITQHPQLLDINVRKLVGRHIHVKRNFGREVATLYQWEECVNPQDKGITNRALKTTWAYPKEHYAWYHSAEVHTVKKDFPVKPVAVLAFSVLAIVGLGWFATDRLMHKEKEPVVAAESSALPSAVTEKPTSSWSTDSFVSRVAAWQWSAPFYDEIAKVQSPPRIIGCMQIDYGDRVECRCSNGQGDAQVDELMCHNFMQGRIYDPTRPPEDIKAENIRRLDASQRNDASGEGDSTGTTLSPPRQTEAAGRS